MKYQVPELVRRHIYNIFSGLNDSLSRKISLMPNVPEESLDISFIDNLSNHSAPTIVSPGWAVRMAAHFIGNIRHRRRYEVADIGVVLEFKRKARVLGRKLLLLQSKRLYPNNHQVIELGDYDYDLGLGMITGQDSNEESIFLEVEFEFDHRSTYGALKAKSNQISVIQEHMKETGIPVYYMTYNPVVLPWQISYPRNIKEVELPERSFGTRVIKATEVHSILGSCPKHSPLKLADLVRGNKEIDSAYGWSLEDFIDGAVKCRHGHFYDSQPNIELHRLFYRKSGPIFCVLEIVIEDNS